MCHRGAFREDINKKCLLCEKEDNGIEHVINNCNKLKKERNDLITELNKLDANTKNKTLLKVIEYYYYSKKLSNSKDGKKKDNKGIKLIKTFIKNMYYLYGKIKRKKMNKQLYIILKKLPILLLLLVVVLLLLNK